MLKTLQNAFKVKDVRHRIFYVLMMLVVIRIGSQLPVPGVDGSYFKTWFESQTGDAFNFLDAFTGGSFSQMSIFALSITPYITSSIIIQLLTIAIPKLEEMAGSDWMDSKGKQIKNTEEWRRIYQAVHALPETHKLVTKTEKHSYSSWIQEEMIKRTNECKRIMGEGLEPPARTEPKVNGIPGYHY